MSFKCLLYRRLQTHALCMLLRFSAHTHTHALTTRTHILGPNEALGGCAHLKNISPTAWLFLWLFVHELMHRTDTIHSGHRQATRSPLSLAPFVFFAASSHSDIYVCPSPQSAKHRDLLKHSCFQEQTTTSGCLGLFSSPHAASDRARALVKRRELLYGQQISVYRRKLERPVFRI